MPFRFRFRYLSSLKEVPGGVTQAGNLFDMYQVRIKAALPPDEPERLSENAVWRYLLQILLGVQHAHSKHIVHRGKERLLSLDVCSPLQYCRQRAESLGIAFGLADLKTANIFPSNDDFIKIGDLGERSRNTQDSKVDRRQRTYITHCADKHMHSTAQHTRADEGVLADEGT